MSMQLKIHTKNMVLASMKERRNDVDVLGTADENWMFYMALPCNWSVLQKVNVLEIIESAKNTQDGTVGL